MKNLHTISLLFFFLIGIISCKNNAQKPFGKDPALEKRKWMLVELQGQKIEAAADEQQIHLTFEGESNTFGGNAGCNQCNGMYTTQDDMIRLHMMAVTKMACPAMETESKFLKSLDESNRYVLQSIKENKQKVEYLYLYKDQEMVMKLKAFF